MKKIVLFLLTSILFLVIFLSTKNTYSAYIKKVEKTFNITTTKSEAIFLPGTDFNAKIKSLAGNSEATYLSDNNNIVNFEKVNVLNIVPTLDNILSDSNSDFPIYGWFNNGVIYYYTEAENIYLNEDSSYMFYR